MDEFNPYQAPSTNVAPQGRRSRWRWNGAFVVIFVVNLIVPALMATSVLRATALLGVVIGIAVMFLFGSWICSHGRTFALIFVRGSALVALSQITFSPQFMAGAISINAARLVGVVGPDVNGNAPVIETSLGGCFVTILTAAILMLAAATIGLILRLITPARWWVSGDRLPQDDLFTIS